MRETLLENLKKSLQSGEIEKKLKSSNNRSQPFRKAFSTLPKDSLVLDCTCGYALDALCMASWGAKVTACERNEDVFTALQIFWPELLSCKGILSEAAKKVEIFHCDAIEKIKSLPFSHAYIDPIYPQKTKAALGKKKLRSLKEIVGADIDSSKLLRDALMAKIPRVIVKRPIKSEILDPDIAPSLQIKGSSTRYDVFFSKAKLP